MVGHLDAAIVPYLLTGSFAASAHGLVRSTYDFDLVIAPDADSLRTFVKSLSPDEYYVDEAAAMEALRRRSMFNVIDRVSQWKFDLIVSRRDDFAGNQFDRRELATVADVEV